MRHARAEHHASVTPRADPERLASRLGALFAKCPTDRVDRTRPTCLRYREEPPWFLAMAGVSMALLGLLGALTNVRTPTASWAAWALVVVLEVTAGICLARLAVAVALRVEVRAEPERVIVARCIGTREFGRRVLDPFAVTAALVVGKRGSRNVVLVGARNEELARVYAERWADPPSLATWWADAVACVVAAAATDLASVENARMTDTVVQDPIASAPLRD